MKIDVKGTIVHNDEKWIYDMFEMQSTAPKDVLPAIEQAKGERLDVYINSEGGDIGAGSEIYAALQEYKGTVLIICHEPEFYRDVVTEVWNCEDWTTVKL